MTTTRNDDLRQITIRPVDITENPMRVTVQVTDSLSGYMGTFSLPSEMDRFQTFMERHCNENNVLLVNDDVLGVQQIRADIESPWVKVASHEAHTSGLIDGEGYDPRFETNPIFLGLPEHVEIVLTGLESQGRTFFRLAEGMGNTDRLTAAQREALITVDELRQALLMARQNTEFTALMVSEDGTLGFGRAVDLPQEWIEAMDKAFGIVRS
jgi:hypothetical protein